MAHSKKHREAISRGLKAYHKGKSKRKYTASQQRAFDKSKSSKSGHKTWKQRQKQKKPGLWANVWAKRKRKKS